MSFATEPEASNFAVVSRRRKSYYLQRPDGSAMIFATRPSAQAVCDALNREDPNDEEPEYLVIEATE